MTDADKLAKLKKILGITGTSEDDLLNAYLDMSKQEILNWMYSLCGGVPTTVTAVPSKYEITQIYAVVAGYNLMGAENQKAHNENGINRTFHYSDMVEYIRNNVVAYIGLGA